MTWREWAKSKMKPKLSQAASEAEKDALIYGIALEVVIFGLWTLSLYGI